MSKWFLVFLPRLLQLIPLALLCGPMRPILAAPHPSAFLLNALISHAGDGDEKPASHISDYRQQPRSDSRADKPDSFPGFDAAGEVRSPLAVSSLSPSSSSSSSSASSSASTATLGDRLSSAFAPLNQQLPPPPPPPPPPTEPLRRPSARTEFYAQLVAKIIGNIGVDNILGSVERKRDKLQRLRRLKQLKADAIASAVRRGEAALGVSRTPLDPQASANDFVSEEAAGDYEADDVDEDDDNEVIHRRAGVVQVLANRNKTANKAQAEAAQSSSAAAPKLSTKNATPPSNEPAAAAPAAAAPGLANAFRHVPDVFAIPANYVTSLWMRHTRPNQLRNKFGLTDQNAVSGRTGYVAGQQKPDSTSQQRDADNFHPTPAAPDSPALSWWLSALRGIWNSATKNAYVNLGTTRTTNAAERHVERQSQLQKQQHQSGFVNNAGFNLQRPSSMQIATTPVTSTTSPAAGDGRPSRLTRAKLAFVDAFIKYSQSLSNGSKTVVDDVEINRTAAAVVKPAAYIADDVSAESLGTSNDGNNTKDVAAAAAVAGGPEAAAPAAPAADEFDANLNINDNVVAVGLAVERIAQLYGYRVPNNQTAHSTLTPTMASATASDADGNQTGRATYGRHEQHRLRRVGERFISLNKAKHRRMAPSDVGGGGGGRRNAPEDSDAEDVGEEIEGTGSTSSEDGDGGGFIGAAESVGIFVLEILGTIAGLGWGALTFLQTLIYAR